MLNQMKDMIKDINNDIDNLENIKKNDIDTKNEINDMLDNNKMILDMVNLMNKQNSDFLQINKDDKQKEIKEFNTDEIKDDKLEDYLS